MRLIRWTVVIAGLGLLVGGLGVSARAVSGVAGSCELVQLHLTVENNLASLKSFGGECAIGDFDTVGVTKSANGMGSILISSPDMTVACSGTAVSGVTGTVTFTVYGSGGYVRSFPNVWFTLDSSAGPQAATLMLDGPQFAGTGTFTRNGTGNCLGRTATWSLGHVSFEDPTL